MAEIRTRRDTEHPCLVKGCGAPWVVTEQSIHVDEVAEPVGWVPIAAGCSRGITAHSLEEYNQGLEDRANRGWPV